MTATEQSPAQKLSKNEGLKVSCPTLAGTIAQGLSDATSDHFSDEDYEFLKFHGVYQQDDRDLRKSGAKHYMMMVRTRFPGGVLNGKQYVVCDDLAARFGNNTLRVTTRQDFQFHGVIKSNVRSTIRSLNEALMTTIAACGDVARNVMAPPTPATSPVVDEILAQAANLSAVLSPKTRAYHSIWLEGQELDLVDETKAYSDPLYGQNYLPRKFKVAFAIPPINDVDVFANDLGFVAIVEDGKIAGYNLLAGGGLGMSHGNARTFPRIADIIGFIAPENLEAFARAVLTVHRDFGDRGNRKHARLKYVIAERGVNWFRKEIELRAGILLGPSRPFQFSTQGDLFGWHQQQDGNWFLGLFVENGRIIDLPGYQLKTGLRRAIEKFLPEVRLTPSQNLLLVNVSPGNRVEIDSILSEHRVSSSNPFSRTRLASMACPSLPTCGLGLAESERALPGFLTQIEEVLSDLGLQDEEIVVRMTGCPNGCSRPYLSEVAFVGKAPNKYQIYLGGSETGTRLNRVYKDSVKGEDIPGELRVVLTRFVAERAPGERFGNFCHRVLWASESELAPTAAT